MGNMESSRDSIDILIIIIIIPHCRFGNRNVLGEELLEEETRLNFLPQLIVTFIKVLTGSPIHRFHHFKFTIKLFIRNFHFVFFSCLFHYLFIDHFLKYIFPISFSSSFIHASREISSDPTFAAVSSPMTVFEMISGFMTKIMIVNRFNKARPAIIARSLCFGKPLSPVHYFLVSASSSSSCSLENW